jgi:hypothetical protein
MYVLEVLSKNKWSSQKTNVHGNKDCFKMLRPGNPVSGESSTTAGFCPRLSPSSSNLNALEIAKFLQLHFFLYYRYLF